MIRSAFPYAEKNRVRFLYGILWLSLGFARKYGSSSAINRPLTNQGSSPGLRHCTEYSIWFDDKKERGFFYLENRWLQNTSYSKPKKYTLKILSFLEGTSVHIMFNNRPYGGRQDPVATKTTAPQTENQRMWHQNKTQLKAKKTKEKQARYQLVVSSWVVAFETTSTKF